MSILCCALDILRYYLLIDGAHGAGRDGAAGKTGGMNMSKMEIRIDYGTRIVWGEPVEESEHEARLEVYDGALRRLLTEAYPEAAVRVTAHRGRGDSVDLAVYVDHDDVTDRYRQAVERVTERAFEEACQAQF